MVGCRTLSSKEVAAARQALRHEGFVRISDVFTADQVGRVERLLDRLIWAAEADPEGVIRRHARDMSPRRPGEVLPVSGSEWGQPEVDYAGCFSPELLETDLFGWCRDLAGLLGGPVSRVFDHAIYKPAGKHVATAWHQDYAFSRLGSARIGGRLHFWIPLQDTPVGSGCMEFIPKSLHGRPIRHDPFLRQAGSRGLRLPDIDLRSAVPCPVACGGLTIHTPYTIHSTGPNLTDRPRKVWIVQFALFGRLRIGLKRLLGQCPDALVRTPG